MMIFWVLVFILSLLILIKGADWFVESSEKIALFLRVSPFIIGVTIVAIGTSFPELTFSLFATLKDATSLVTSNVVGSNVANILLIIGLSAIIGRKLAVQRSLIDIDLPLLASTTALFGFIFLDKKISQGESVLLLLAFFVYLFYTIQQKKEESEKTLPEEMANEIVEVLPSRIERRKVKEKVKKIDFKTVFLLILGLILLISGANFLVDATKKLSEIFRISSSIISILGVAVGTSLPELVVSVRAAWQKRYEIALGNVFGSNVFNALVVTGLPGLIKTLQVDEITFSLGFPFMVIATLLLVISGITRRVSVWEGAMFLLVYILFVIKLFEMR